MTNHEILYKEKTAKFSLPKPLVLSLLFMANECMSKIYEEKYMESGKAFYLNVAERYANKLDNLNKCVQMIRL